MDSSLYVVQFIDIALDFHHKIEPVFAMFDVAMMRIQTRAVVVPVATKFDGDRTSGCSLIFSFIK